MPTALTVTITNATISSRPVVQFRIEDQDGFAFTGFQQGTFTIAKLVPGQDGDSAAWQSYINRIEQPGTGPWPGTAATIQATGENTNNGELINNGDGTYQYTFATDVAAVASPVSVPFQPELTHRIGMQVGGQFRGQPLPAANAVYTFQPSTGLTSGIADRRIVTQASCNNCHGDTLAIHGGNRVAVEYCVTCHNPGTVDAQSGNSVDFPVMVHKIHMGQDLPSVIAGDSYSIWGFGNSIHDYSDVAYPQDVRNCLNCHDPDNPATPEALQIVTKPTVQACGSCHDDVNFVTGENHGPGLPVGLNNEACTICHSPSGFAGGVLESHAMPTKLASANFQLNVLDLSVGAGEALVTFSVTNPNDGSAYELPGPFRALTARLNWTEGDSADYASPSGPNVNLLNNAVPTGNGTYSASINIAGNPPVNPGVFALGLEGSSFLDGAVSRIAGATRFFAPDATPDTVQRRQVVTDVACGNCHERYEGPYSGHGQNRTDHVQLCAMCHNPTRVSDQGGARPPHSGSTDLMYMVHAIHAAEVRGAVEYRNRGGVRYPGRASDCSACHAGNTFQLTSLPAGRAPLQTQSTGGALFVSQQTAVCWSCHTDTVAAIHMQQNGGQINVTAGELLVPSQETCSVCHGPGQVADVRSVHRVR